MSASQDDLIGVYEFEVQLGLMINLSFSKISGISRSGDVGIIGNGGDNDSMHFYLKPRRKPDVIRFEKGWATGMESTIMSWLTEGLIINDIMIIVKQNGSMKKILSIDKAVLTRITYSDLDAMRGDVMIKSMELQHTGVNEISV